MGCRQGGAKSDICTSLNVLEGGRKTKVKEEKKIYQNILLS
jgi:hypothetical protein